MLRYTPILITYTGKALSICILKSKFQVFGSPPSFSETRGLYFAGWGGWWERNLDKLRGSSWSLSVKAWRCSKAEEVRDGKEFGGDRQRDRQTETEGRRER